MTEEWRVRGPLIPSKLKGTMKDEQKQGCQRFLACLFLTAVDKTKYSTVINNTNQQLFPQGTKQVLHWYLWHGSHVGDPLWQLQRNKMPCMMVSKFTIYIRGPNQHKVQSLQQEGACSWSVPPTQNEPWSIKWLWKIQWCQEWKQLREEQTEKTISNFL